MSILAPTGRITGALVLAALTVGLAGCRQRAAPAAAQPPARAPADTPAPDRPPPPAAQAVTRGDVVQTVVERGTLEAARSHDVVCTVRADKPGNAAVATIKWVIDDGTVVKKGDK